MFYALSKGVGGLGGKSYV